MVRLLDHTQFVVLTLLYLFTMLYGTEGVFRNNEELNGYLCNVESLVDTGPARSTVDCGLRCDRVQDCESFFFVGGTTQCLASEEIFTSQTNCILQTFNVKYFAKDMTISGACSADTDCPIENTVCWDNVCACQVGMVVASGGKWCEQGTTNFGGVCTSTTDCYGSNVGCWQGVCYCEPGYSLVSETRTCEDDCLQYGSTFANYPGHTLACPDSPKLPGYTVEQCLQECQSQGCVSMRYHHGFVECKIDTCTPVSNPEAFLVYPGVDLYIRNCL